MSEADIKITLRFDPVPFYRAMGGLGARLGLLVAKDPRRRWKLQYRLERLERRCR